MPPRYSYWTIIVDDQPTAFRAALVEDLLPTFNRLRQKHPSAVMKWFERGRLWTSRGEAHDALVEARRAARPDSREARWRPSGDRPPAREPRWRPSGDRAPARDVRWRPSGDRPPARDAKWRPSGDKPPARESRWRPNGDGPPARDAKWRPGGEHRDPKQKFKDAKKARWQRFKQRIRRGGPPRKRNGSDGDR
jgi:hypothetical protein